MNTKSLINVIDNDLATMTGGEIKAFLVIWRLTHASTNRYGPINCRKITNDQISEIGGKCLAKTPAVVTSTDALAEKNIIAKTLDKEVDSLNVYCIKANREGVTVLEEVEK